MTTKVKPEIHWGKYEKEIVTAMAASTKASAITRLWDKDPSLWKSNPSDQNEITNRLGWLDAPHDMRERIPEIMTLVQEIKKEKIKYLVLLGMGGSSLAPEVFQSICGSEEGHPDLIVVDSTDPRKIREIEERIANQPTWYIVASKSGTTIESASLYRYFYHKLQASGQNAGEAFIAITDPGTFMEEEAKKKNFRQIFLNDPNVGGRFSALTYFGIVPAALIGVNVEVLMDKAKEIAKAVKETTNIDQNPAGILGISMAYLAKQGRDKLTFVSTTEWESLGDWIEQLIAESTGKENQGIIPIVREPLQDPKYYGNDRYFIALLPQNTDTNDIESKLKKLTDDGHPVLVIPVGSPIDLGKEFYRFEAATALAGSLMQVNPFDQPNVQAAKACAKAMLKDADAIGKLNVLGKDDDKDAINKLSEVIQENDCIHLLAFLPDHALVKKNLFQLSQSLRQRTKCAVCIGIGPRYLHSTGQLHKGGQNNGVFLLITSPILGVDDLKIPEAEYSFGQLLKAQAMGDLQALKDNQRRTFHINLSEISDKAFQDLIKQI